MLKKILGTVLAATLVMALFAGCAGDGSPSPADATDPGEAATTDEEAPGPDEEETPAQEAPGDADNSQYINIPMIANPTMLDPALTSDGQSGILGFIVEALMKVDKDFNLIPGIAESYEVNEDATVFTYKIKEGVLFHDGTPCDAEAVAWNYNRQIGENATPDMPYSGTIFGNMVSAEAADELTLVITLSESDSTLPIYLAMPNGTGLVSPTAWQADPEGFQRHPVGAGPYLFNEWADDQYVRLEANPNYHDGQVQNAGVNFRIIKDTAVKTSEYLAGGLDYINEVSVNDIDQIEGSGYTVVSHPSLGYVFYNFADYESNEIFSDIRVRQAIWHALDREAIVNALYNNRANVANSMIPPGMYGGDAEYTTYEYNPDRARELLEEAGYGEGLEINLVSRNESEYQALAVAVQMELAKVGITMNIELMQRADWLEQVFNENPQHDMIQFNWGAASNDPSYMAALWLSFNAVTGYNASGYNNPEFDAIIAEARKTGDPAEQSRLYAQAGQMINDDAPSIFFNIIPAFTSTSPKLNDPEGLLGSFSSCPFWMISKNAD